MISIQKWKIIAVATSLYGKFYSKLGPVCNETGNCLWASKSPQYVTKPATKANSALSGTENEYQMKRGDAPWLGSKRNMAHSIYH